MLHGSTRCLPDEKPLHQVALSKGFWMGQTEVTVDAYTRFAKSTRCLKMTRSALESIQAARIL
jgi:formylglycine-generating enzyme required for sulfatase activity